MSRYAIFLVLAIALLQTLLVSRAGAQPYVPLNAQPRLVGPGWECLAGFRRVDDHCERISVPVNAVLSIDGRGWECLDGFRRRDEQCERIAVPANAALSLSSGGWDCFDGFRRVDDRCQRTGTPVSADPRPSRACPLGKRNINGRCIPFLPPSNAAYADNGDGWACLAGYRRIDNGCRELTDRERMVLAQTVPGYGGTAVSMASVMAKCTVVDSEGRYGRLSCDGPAFNRIERGCFAVATMVSGADDGVAIKCPSQSLQEIARNCVVIRAATLNGSGGGLECFGRDSEESPEDGLADSLSGGSGRG